MDPLFQSALEHIKAGDVAQAERLFLKVLEQNPNHVRALMVLSSIRSYKGDKDGAIKLLNQCINVLIEDGNQHTVEYALGLLAARGFSPVGILDIGAYVGKWTQMVKEIFPAAQVLMVEPQPHLAARLQALEGDYGGTVHFKAALLGREHRDKTVFYLAGGTTFGSSGSSIFAEQTRVDRHAVEMPMQRLDDLTQGCGIETFQLIKLDVQGAELEVLAGGMETLQGAEAVIMEMSLLPYNEDAPLIADVIAEMKRLGFRVADLFTFSRLPNGVLLQVDAVFLREGSALTPQPPYF